jgi:protein-L-isoaspartate(D-aspartate) O-methyltransferase
MGFYRIRSRSDLCPCTSGKCALLTERVGRFVSRVRSKSTSLRSSRAGYIRSGCVSRRDARRHSNAPRYLGVGIVVFGILAIASMTAVGDEQNYTAKRAKMIRTIEAQAHNTSSAIGRDHIDTRVLDVMGAIPRHEFVPEDLREASYEDRPLPIGYGQTISQPLIVALMTDILNINRSSLVLEVGTGSGYQAAVAATLAHRVYTIEIIPELARSAANRLRQLGYTNVAVRIGDGYFGWPDVAPFDGIIVTAAAGHIPPPLLEQLKPGGRMVIPVGPPLGQQHLTVVERAADGRIKTRQLFPVRFVPLTGQHP